MTAQETKQRCEARVCYDSWGHSHQCYKPAIIQQDGKWYCKIHDPEYIEQKKQERQRKWDAEWSEKQKQWHREEVIKSLTKGFSIETLSKHTANIREFIQSLEGK